MNKENMIKELKKFNFPDKIMDAFEKVDRSLFVSPELKEESYKNVPLPIFGGQTISQPYTIAFMLTLLEVEEGDKILEVGSGSGYVLALLSELNKNGKILGIERISELVQSSKEKLKNYENIEINCGNALKKIGDEKFDRILVSAAFDEFPSDLVNNNLKFKGVLVAPVRDSIVVVKKESGENKIQEFQNFVFVPIVND